jgi:adenylate kinase family enzyme
LKNRLVIYHRNAAPLIAYYEKQGKFASVNSMAPIPDVSDAIGRAIA